MDRGSGTNNPRRRSRRRWADTKRGLNTGPHQFDRTASCQQDELSTLSACGLDNSCQREPCLKPPSSNVQTPPLTQRPSPKAFLVSKSFARSADPSFPLLAPAAIKSHISGDPAHEGIMTFSQSPVFLSTLSPTPLPNHHTYRGLLGHTNTTGPDCRPLFVVVQHLVCCHFRTHSPACLDAARQTYAASPPVNFPSIPRALRRLR